MKPLSITLLILLSLILVFSISIAGDSENVEMLGRIYNQWITAYDVVVCGEYAYVATGVSGLQIVDISNPEAPEIVGFYDDYRGLARRVAISGDYAYVASDLPFLLILDISDPTNPVYVSEYVIEGYPMGIAVSGDYVFITNSWADISELNIIDISNPAEPQEAAVYENLEAPFDVIIEGDYAFVADYANGLKILNIYDVENIQEVGFNSAPQNAASVFVLDEYAYVANSRNGLYIIDISDIENPDSVGSCATDGGVNDIYVIGNYAYVSLDQNLAVIDVSDRTTPEVVSTMNMGLSKAYDLFVVDSTAFIADGRGSLWSVNVADPAEPESIGCTVEYWGDANDVVVNGDYMYAAYGGGLRVIDISNPYTPQEIGMELSGGEPMAVLKSGDYAYIADYDSGLVVINISDPENPAKVAALSTLNFANDITISGSLLYLTNSRSMTIININDPENPQVTGTYDDPDNANCVSVSGNIAYVADSENLHIIDVSHPENPGAINVIGLPGQIGGIDVYGDYIYLTHYSWEDELSTLRVFDFTNPLDPNETGFTEVIGIPEGLSVDDEYIFVTGGIEQGLQQFINHPEDPELYGFYDTPGYAKNIFTFEDKVIVADRTNFGIYQITMGDVNDGFADNQPVDFRLLPAYPNPFNAVTNISFELPYRSDVSLKVYDLSGRSVASVFNGSQTVGVHSVLWNAGNHPSGVYFIRFEADGFNFEQRVMLVK